MGVTNALEIFLKSKLPVWPENCWIKYLAQVFPEPGADAIAVRGPEDFCEKKMSQHFLDFWAAHQIQLPNSETTNFEFS